MHLSRRVIIEFRLALVAAVAGEAVVGVAGAGEAGAGPAHPIG